MKFIITLMVFILPAMSQAQKINVFEVRKNLQLSNTDPVYKDYYVSAGFAEGIQKGMVINVVRRLPIHDGLKNQSQGELVMTIARIQIFHVQKNISVGRMYRATTARTRPIADFNAIMIGDELDMTSAAMPVKRKSKKAKVSKKSRDRRVEPLSPVFRFSGKPKPTQARAPAVRVGGEMTAINPPSLQ